MICGWVEQLVILKACPIEAIRQFHNDNGHENSLFIHVTLVPYIASSGELKTKPTQHSVKELKVWVYNQIFYYCRSDRIIPEGEEKKLVYSAMFNITV